MTAAYAQARSQLVGALEVWDFSGIFPSGWLPLSDGSDARGVLIVPAHPYDIIQNMLQETKTGSTAGMMTQPIISIALGHSTDTFRTLGDVDVGHQLPRPASGMWRRSTRIGLVFLVSCWADERLGGYETVEALGGEVESCMFYNRTRLAAFRHLRCHNQEPAYIDTSEIWTIDLYVEGDAKVSYDEPMPVLP